MWVNYNPNPAARNVGDCAVRAVAKALNIDWERAYALIAKNGFIMGDVMTANWVWGSVLKQHGFTRHVVENTCPDCYTAEEFCRDHPEGIYVLCFGNHVATEIDGTLFDSWDSSKEVLQYFWVKED